MLRESAVMPSTCAVSRLAPVSWRTTLHNALGRVSVKFIKESFILSSDVLRDLSRQGVRLFNIALVHKAGFTAQFDFNGRSYKIRVSR